MRSAGRVIATIAALGAMTLWAIFLFRNPYAPAAQGPAFTFGGLMMVSAMVCAGAALLGAHLAMYLLFFVSFFPVGAYVLSGPGLFSAIGWLNIAYLMGAILVHRALVTAKTKRPDREV